MGVRVGRNDPLLGGFYTIREAARLLQIENRQRIYRWLRPSRKGVGAVLTRDYKPLDKSQELSFWDLIEVRFVEHFRRQGLSLQYLRKVAVLARREFKTQHPFALSKAEFLTDRKRIFEQTAEGEGRKVRELLSGQYEMYEAIEEVLAKGLAFNPKTFLAEEWTPLKNDCPNVVVNPRYDFGRPVIGPRHVPTAAIFRQWKAEKGDRSRVADWWQIEIGEVDEAIEFEVRMAV
ncbi:MAG: hypothetical protein ACE5Q3_08530 [Alphaproteobacteria bacterium]